MELGSLRFQVGPKAESRTTIDLTEQHGYNVSTDIYPITAEPNMGTLISEPDPKIAFLDQTKAKASNGTSVTSTIDMLDENITLTNYLLRKVRWLTVAIILFTFIIYKLTFSSPPLYVSDAVVFVEPEPKMRNTIDIFPEPSTNLRRVLGELGSTDFYDYLIKRFDLHAHYNISAPAPNNSIICYTILDRRITLTQKDETTLKIKVHDEDPEIAALMANESINYIQASSFDKFNARQNQLIRSYQQLIDSSRSRFMDQLNSLNATLLAIRTGSSDVNENTMTYQSLTTMLSELESANSELTNSLRLQEISKTILSNGMVTRIEVIRSAFPDIETSIVGIYATRILLIAIFATILVVGCASYWYMKRRQILKDLHLLNTYGQQDHI